MVEHIVHGVEIGDGSGDGESLAKTIHWVDNKEVDKGTSVLTDEVGEGKLSLSE